MAINETIVINRKWRKCIDIVNKTWQRISFWTHSSDVEFTDGKTAETKVGAIDGITDSLASNSSRIAASAKAVNTLSNDLAQQPEWVYDSTGKITGYKTQNGGAGTVFPFSSCKPIGEFVSSTSPQTFNVVSACPDYKSLTAKNFMMAVSNVTIYTNSNGGTTGNGNISGSVLPTLSYNASTGILTLSATSIKKYGNDPTHLYTTVGICGSIYRI